MITISTFFSKLEHYFFEKGQGRPPPSSYAYGKITPRNAILFMHFPNKTFEVLGQFVAYIVFQQTQIFWNRMIFAQAV